MIFATIFLTSSEKVPGVHAPSNSNPFFLADFGNYRSNLNVTFFLNTLLFITSSLAVVTVSNVSFTLPLKAQPSLLEKKSLSFFMAVVSVV